MPLTAAFEQVTAQAAELRAKLARTIIRAMRIVLEIMVLSLPCFFLDSDPAHSCAYCPDKRQRPGGAINAVHRDAVRAGIGHIGELTGRMDGYRGRGYLRSYCSCGR